MAVWIREYKGYTISKCVSHECSGTIFRMIKSRWVKVDGKKITRYAIRKDKKLIDSRLTLNACKREISRLIEEQDEPIHKS